VGDIGIETEAVTQYHKLLSTQTIARVRFLFIPSVISV